MPKGGNVIQKGQKIVLKVVVSGTAVELDVNEHQPLKSLMERAFEGASVVGGSDNWYFTDEAGNELDAEKKIAELGLVNGQVVLLNQRAGAAG